MTKINDETIYLKNDKFEQKIHPSIVEGVVLYQRPIDSPAIKAMFTSIIKDELSMTQEQLVKTWNQQVARRISNSQYVNNERKIPQYYNSVEQNKYEAIFDFIFFVNSAKLLSLITPEQSEDLLNLKELGASTDIDIITSIPSIQINLDSLYHFCFNQEFTNKALKYQLINKDEHTEISNLLSSLDPYVSNGQDYQNKVIEVLNRPSGDNLRYDEIRIRLETVYVKVGGELIDGASNHSLEQKLNEVTMNTGKVISPSDIELETGNYSLVESTILSQLNEPTVTLEVLHELRSYTAQPMPGNTIKTHSLFPGEKAVITIETFKKSSTNLAQTTSVADETSTKAEESLANEANFENTYNQESNRNNIYKSSIKAKATWGWGSAGGSYEQSSTSKNIAKRSKKNISKALKRQVSNVSNNRSVKVETSSTIASESSEKHSIVRTIENINVSAPLNFFFKQLVHTTVSILSITDCRLVIKPSLASPPLVTNLESFPDFFRKNFFDNSSSSLQEQNSANTEIKLLYQKIVDDLLEFGKSSIESSPKLVKKDTDILDSEIPRYQVEAGDVKKLNLNELKQPVENLPEELAYRGLLSNVDVFTMKTEGVHVSCFVDTESKGLDKYSSALQDEEARARKIANDLSQVENRTLGIILKEFENSASIDDKIKVMKELLIPYMQSKGDISNDDTP